MPKSVPPKPRSRAQSAVEYLVTYGWAMLLIGVVISLLYLYLIVPGVVASNSCSFLSGAYCVDLVLGSNVTTHSSVMALFITNTQPYPIKDPSLYTSINGVNSTVSECKPDYVLAGGSMICSLPITQTTTLGQFLSGDLYLNATYCGLSSTPGTCVQAPNETYKGSFGTHAQPLVSTSSSITLTAVNTTHPGNPADGAEDPLTATVKLLGYPLSGATVNFTAAFQSNGTNAVPPYSLESQYATTGPNGVASDYIAGTTVGNVIVTAYYAGLTSNALITFVPVTKVTFSVSTASALSGSAATLATIDGTNYDYNQLTSTTFDWGCGTTHTYSFVSTPSISTGTRLSFQHDVINGVTYSSSSGTITVNCALYNQTQTAVYQTQYEYIPSINPSSGGTVSPTQGWYAVDSGFRLSETAAANYTFKNWTGTGVGSYTGTLPSPAVLMGGPVTETANYYAPVTITLANPSLSGTSNTIVTVDGVAYNATQLPAAITASYGSIITYSYSSTIAGSTGTQYVNPTVSGCGVSSASGSFSATGSCTLSASYTTQYYLTMAASPSSDGTVSPSSAWYNSGSPVTISETPNSNYIFQSWSGSGTGSYSGTTASTGITMSAPITETADYEAPLTMTFASSSLTGSTANVVEVNNVYYTASQLPASISVAPGSTVTYSYASTLSGGTGTQYITPTVSGCGQTSASGSFTASSACTVTGSYTTQYQLTMAGVSPSGAGTVTPAAGTYWYNSGSAVTISETPSGSYTFNDWTGSGTGSYTGTSASTSITMSAPITETANYYTSVTVTFTSSSMTGTSGTVVTVDGTAYTASQLPASIPVTYGSTVTYSYTSPVSGASGTQYAYSSLSGCGQTAQSGSFSATSACTVTGSYTTQYYLTMAVSPSGGGTASPSSGWYNSGSAVTISETPATNYVFKNWTGSGTGSYSGTTASTGITMSAPVTETANYYAPVVITFTSSAMSGTSANVVTVDGTNYAYSSLPEALTVPYGSTVTYSYTSPVSGASGTQYVYSSLSGCSQTAQSGSFTATSTCTITASYLTQYYLTMAVSPSGGGTVTPSSGWYNSGASVGISESPSTNYVFDTWTCTGTGCYSSTGTSTTITMNNPITETATYYAPVTITFTSSAMSGTSGTVVTVDGTGVAYSSFPYSITVPYSSSVAYSYSSPIAGASGTQYVYSSVSGCGQSAQSNSFSATSACTVTASYTTQYYLTMAVSPSGGGTVTPASAWYNSGSAVTISETPATNYVFEDWAGSGTGSYSGTTASTGITMSAPITETATYYPPPTLTFTSSSMSGTSATVVTVDGTNIAYSSFPYSIIVPYGSTVTYAYSSPIAGASGTQYAYSSLSGCSQTAQSGSFSATSTCTVTASYTTQYYLTMAGVSPSGAGSVSPASAWYNSGSGVTISESPATNYVFKNWTGSGTGSYSGTTASTSITMSAPITETANYYAPVTITFASSSMSGTSATVVTADSTNYAYSQLPVSITVSYGSTVTYSYASSVAGGSGTQYAYSSLSGCGQTAQSGSFSATSTCTVTGSYTTQYYLTMAVSPSGSGSVSPGSGWYNSGSGVGITASPSSGYSFNDWTGSGTGSYSGTTSSTSITMGAPITETAYYLTCTGTNSTTITSYWSVTAPASATVSYTMYGGGSGGSSSTDAGSSGSESTGSFNIAAGQTLTVYVGGGGGGSSGGGGGGGGSGYYGGGGGGYGQGAGGGSSAILVAGSVTACANGGPGYPTCIGGAKTCTSPGGGTCSSGGTGGTVEFFNTRTGAITYSNGYTGGFNSGGNGVDTYSPGVGGYGGSGGTGGNGEPATSGDSAAGGGGGYGGGGGGSSNSANAAGGSGGSNGGNGVEPALSGYPGGVGTGGDTGEYGSPWVGGNGGSVSLNWTGSSCPV